MFKKTMMQARMSTVGIREAAMQQCKTYKRRWLMLAIFVMYSASNAMQWTQYAIIADVISDYYNVSLLAVHWTSMIYMVLYIPFVFPASFILDKLGLRMAVLLGSIGTCAGTWIKLASLDTSLFWVTFLGQSLIALSQIFILSVPSKLAAVWFSSAQVSSACSIGVFGNQLGCAIGFVIPPMMVTQGSDEHIRQDLKFMFIVFGAITTVILVLIFTLFQDRPPRPPSMAQVNQNVEGHDKTFCASVKTLMCNQNFIFLVLGYGMNVGIFYAISTLLNQVVLHYYPTAAIDAGRIGLVIVLSGMLGSVACGVVLDKYRRFKETTVIVYIFTLLGLIAYTCTLHINIAVVYCTAGFLGFFMTGLLPVGFEFAVELTYPEPEGTSSGILNASAQIFGIICTTIGGVILTNLGEKWSHGIMIGFLVVGAVLTWFIKPNLKRQAVNVNEAIKEETIVEAPDNLKI